MKWEEHKVYTTVYAGMGCCWYVTRENNWEKFKLFCMDSDSWGQYGPETDNRPILEKFIAGFRLVGEDCYDTIYHE